MRQCLRLLKPDGILLIQTPCYPEGSTYEEMAARSEQPLEILQPGEHLYLFSRPSIRELFARLGGPSHRLRARALRPIRHVPGGEPGGARRRTAGRRRGAP